MPELKCTVQTCMHNKDFYCDLNAITVGGKSARKAAETSCDSFEEMCVDESDGCGRVSPAPVCLCARNERKGAKRMVGEVDGGVRKKV